MRFLLATLALLLALPLVGCDSTSNVAECPNGTDCSDPLIDPDTVDFDDVAEVDFERYVRAILVGRDALSPVATDATADPESVTYAAVLEAGPSMTLVPFDADASLLVRLAEEALAPDSENPLPNLSRLEDDEVRYLRRWIEAGAPDASGRAAYSDADVLLYVCNQFAGRVSIVDVERQRIVRNVYFEELGQPADAKPHHVIAQPDGQAWYVALISGDGGGSVLKLSSDLTMDPAEDGYLLASEMPPDGEGTFQKPGMLAFDAATPRLFAGRSFSADPTSSGIGRFDVSTLAFETIQTPDVHPHALGVSRDGRFMFTAGLTAQSARTPAYVFDAETGDLVDQELIDGALAFVQYAVSPDGETVVLSSQLGSGVYVFDFDTEAGDLTLRGEVETGEQPWHPIFSPDGSLVYVPNRMSNTVSVVDHASLSANRTISNPVGGPFSQPHGSAISADGSVLFVSSRNFNMPMMNMAPAGGMDHDGMSGMDHSQMGDDEMDHSGMDHGAMDHDTMEDSAMSGGMRMAEIAWMPFIRFLDSDGEAESADLYGNVAMIDTATGDILGVIQTGRFASGLAIYDPR
ncbi:MAG: beta-propeller fold lactonase family protein [Bacteroidota bacterium]